MGRKGLFFVLLMGLEACGFADAGGASLDKPTKFDGDDTDTTASSTLPPSSAKTADAGGGPRDAGPSDASSDGGFDASVRGSFFCKEPGLSLCLQFESESVDHSSTGVSLDVANVSYVDGHEGKAVLMDQTSFIRAPANPAFNTSEATIEAWVNRVTGAGVVFDADGRYSLTVLSNGTVQCATSQGSTTGGSAPAGQFVHVACVWGGGKVRVYVNGVQANQNNASIKSAPNATEAVGGNAPSGQPFIGAIDSLRVFAVARTPEEIAAAAAP